MDRKCLKVNEEYIAEIKEEVKEYGLIPMFDTINKMLDKFDCTTKDGYMVQTTIYHLREGKTPYIFSKFNKYTIDNIKKFIKDNLRTDILLSDVFENSNKKLKFQCCKGHTFEMAWKHYKQFHGCPECSKSLGEEAISRFLNKNKIKYEYQVRYEELLGINGGELSYDFFLPKYNLLIEYQGEYHDGNVRNQTKEKLKSQKEHDKRKRKYAKENNIDLLEIWYWDYKNIDIILNNKLKIKEGVILWH